MLSCLTIITGICVHLGLLAYQPCIKLKWGRCRAQTQERVFTGGYTVTISVDYCGLTQIAGECDLFC